MTRLPSDSFLPSGDLDSDLEASIMGPGSQSSPSVISPLALPGSVQCVDGLEPDVVGHTYSSMSGDSRGPPRAQPASFLSPHLTPVSSQTQHQLQNQSQQQRSVSLSPTGRCSRRRLAGTEKTPRRNLVSPPPRMPLSGVNIPFDAISGTGSGMITVRQQVPRVISTEHRFCSETATIRMLEAQNVKLRQAWDDERRYLQANRDRAEEVYKEDRALVEYEHDQARAQWEAEKRKLQRQIQQLQQRLALVESSKNDPIPRVGLGPTGPQAATFQRDSLSRISPSQHPDTSSHIPPNSNHSNARVAMDRDTPSPTIDVREYHPDLEGIPIKANAVNKETFTDTPSTSTSGSIASSGKVSPPSNPENHKRSAKERTLNALKADPSKRLTMHAGHTPTVSLSALPSVRGTGAGNTVSSSGSNTPTLIGGDTSQPSGGDPTELHPSVAMGPAEDHPETALKPSEDDRELKGPLMIRNIPAKDEVFFRRLSDKLEKVNNGEDSVPAVLKHAGEDEGETRFLEEDLKTGDEKAEEDVPLKLKKNSNFGAPFGSL